MTAAWKAPLLEFEARHPRRRNNATAGAMVPQFLIRRHRPAESDESGHEDDEPDGGGDRKPVAAARIDIRESRIAFVFRDAKRATRSGHRSPETAEAHGEEHGADSGDDGETASDDGDAGAAIEDDLGEVDEVGRGEAPR